MPFNTGYATGLVLAAAAMSLMSAPQAAADGADATISDLQAKGYTVHINWLNGASESLPFCTVQNVSDPDSTPHAPAATTLYVDVSCPDHQD